MLNYIKDDITHPVFNLNEVKNYLRVTDVSEDSFVANLMKAAYISCEKIIGTALLKKSLVLRYGSSFPQNIILPYDAIDHITSITLELDDGSSKDISDYQLNQNIISLNTNLASVLDNIKSLRVEYVVGSYESSDVIPEDLKYTIFAHVSFLYDNRGSDLALPKMIKDVYLSYKQMRI